MNPQWTHGFSKYLSTVDARILEIFIYSGHKDSRNIYPQWTQGFSKYESTHQGSQGAPQIKLIGNSF